MNHFKREIIDDNGKEHAIEFYPEEEGTVLVSIANGGKVCRYVLTENDLKWLKESF
jgi:hypothetical protein